METSESDTAESTYLYLDFNGKLTTETLQNEVYFRIENLHKRNPLVQVNDSLFKGTYDHSMGTNLFFEEAEDIIPHSTNAFEKQTPVTLKYLQKSTKVLNLHQVRIPQSKIKIQNEIKNINYNLKWNYNELLEKFENGTLRIEDIVSEEMPRQEMYVEEKTEKEEEVKSKETYVEPETEPVLDEVVEQNLESVPSVKILEAEYDQLKILASRPVRRAVSPELVAESYKKYEKAYEYHNIECQILQPRDGFKSEPLQVDEDTLADCIDIDRCVLYNLISPSSDFPRILTKEEKEKLLTMENFDNLSLAGRYYVLQNLVKDLEECVKNSPINQLEKKDEYGRTVVETLEIFKKLSEAVRNRLQGIKMSLENGNHKTNEDNDCTENGSFL